MQTTVLLQAQRTAVRIGAGKAAPELDGDAPELARLRAGDEAAFVALVGRHHAAMRRVARAYVPSDAVAEEVVQETWIAVLRGLKNFRGESSFRTWLFSILVNRARSVGSRERRTSPHEDPHAVDPSRFGADGMWSRPPERWDEAIDERLDAAALSGTLDAALADLPARQREVLVLRDVEDLTSAEVSDVLGISEGNQRVLLHRGRSRLRNELERRLAA
jgi:RNA polymerase sigma-70 factor (ECF subfamily)